MKKACLSKEQIHVISAVTFGNILEWFEVYLFAYLSSAISREFFNFESSLSNLIFSFLIFGLGFIARPLGGIIFGRIGDLVGRRKAFIWSIMLITIPTFLMGLLPNYQTWGVWAPISLCLLRFIQSIPTGGETPGTICFLFENAHESNKRFITSWSAVGNQIGAILGLCEVFLMDNYLSQEAIFSWGWRVSFFSGSLIGLMGIYLRYTLHETPTFMRLKETHNTDNETISQLISRYKKKIWVGTAFGMIDAATFYLIAAYLPTVIGTSLGFSSNQNIFVSLCILSVTTVLLPFFGRLGDKYSNKLMCVSSALLIIALLYPLSIAINGKHMIMLSIIAVLYLIPVTCITSLIACLLGDLFPSKVRFTGVGISVNLADGIVGGFTPAIALLLTQVTGSQTAFCWYIFLCALISLSAYLTAMKR